MAKTIDRTQMNTYWLERAERNYIAGEKSALQLAKELRLNYNQAIKEIDDRISSFYGRYAKETGLTLEEAKQLLDRNELRDFKGYINEMLKMGEKKNFSPQEMYEFRRLYNKAKITRLEQLQANIRAELDELASNTKNKVEDLLANSYKDGYYKTIYDTQMEFGIDKAFTGLNKQAVEKAVNQKYLQGNYSSRIWENNTKVLSSLLNREIPRGITLGYNPRKLARDVVSPKINKTLYNNTVRLIRTEYGHVLNQATLQGYRQAGISQYKISTTLDSRRCEDCGAYEGEIVNIEEMEEGINCPPFHPNCRCTTIPYFPEDYIDRMTDEELDQIGFVTYQDWKDGLVELKNNKVKYNWKKGLKKE